MNLRACPRGCGTRMNHESAACFQCRRDDTQQASQDTARASNAQTKKPWLKLDLTDHGSKSDRNANARSTRNRSINARRKG